jgi:presenilin-like A22 family membrane protease
VVVAGVDVLAVGLSLGVAVALLVYPEWYVIDLAGVLMGAGGAGLFGISFGLLPAIVLLTALAVYDAISVYGTEHMLSLASGVLDLKVPVVLVIPLSLSYSLLDDEFTPPDPTSDADEGADGAGSDGEVGGVEEGEPAATRPTDGAGPVDADGGDAVDEVAGTGSDDGEDGEGGGVGEDSEDDEEGRDAFFIGLGDAVMPTVMIASAAFYSPAAALGLPLAASANLPALLAMVGTFLGLGVLLWAVFGGRAHAGLPLLNGGAIGGYLLGSMIAGVPLTTAIGL